MYIYERYGWPNFRINQEKISYLLAKARYLQGNLLGKMSALGFRFREEATLKILTQDIIKTSEIEGEKLDYENVRSSLAKRLGINIGGKEYNNRYIDGIVEVMLDATLHYNKELTKDRLFGWHHALFPLGRNGIDRIIVGNWRGKSSGAMQVISGPLGKEKIHYEAPISEKIEQEMQNFIQWFNLTNHDLVIKAAIAHFWFVTIHPFEDGNGRIARALADMMLAKSENNSQRFYSMSSQIQKERTDYYDILEKCQKSNLDITLWVEWFLNCLMRAITSSEEILDIVLAKAKFYEKNIAENFNSRQKIILNILLDGFEGKLTSSKWAKICKCSQDTALRDITDLLNREILSKDEGGGRSTSYSIRS